MGWLIGDGVVAPVRNGEGLGSGPRVLLRVLARYAVDGDRFSLLLEVGDEERFADFGGEYVGWRSAFRNFDFVVGLRILPALPVSLISGTERGDEERSSTMLSSHAVMFGFCGVGGVGGVGLENGMMSGTPWVE